MNDVDKPLIASSINETPEVLRERFQQWGYLYLKGFADRAKCQALLEGFLQQLEPHVQMGENNRPVLKGEPFFETDALWDQVYPEMQAMQAFHSFFHEPEIVALMQAVTGVDDVFVYPMKMARISTPKKIGYETPPHQDAHSHQAGNTMAGIWVALHDVNAQMGRLKVLPKSHLKGVRPVYQAEGVGGVQCEIYPDETEWHVSDVEQGDVIIFHSCMVHKAEPNLSEDTVRMSVDTRFCDYGAPVFVTNIEPHHGWRIEKLDWDYIYRNWDRQDLQHYWRDYPHMFDQLGYAHQ